MDYEDFWYPKHHLLSAPSFGEPHLCYLDGVKEAKAPGSLTESWENRV